MMNLEFKHRLKSLDSRQIILHFAHDETIDDGQITPNPPSNSPQNEAFKRPLLACFNVDYQQGNRVLNTVVSQSDCPKTIQQYVHLQWHIPKKLQRIWQSSYVQSQVLENACGLRFQQANSLRQDYSLLWQIFNAIGLSSHIAYQNGITQPLLQRLIWQEMIHHRRFYDVDYQQANVLKHSPFLLRWDKAIHAQYYHHLVWEQGRAIYYRKSVIPPLLPHAKTQYVGNGTLIFDCKCQAIDSQQVILNFGVNDCIPNLVQKWSYIMNDIQVVRLDNNQSIIVQQGDIQSDRHSWCWSYRLTVPKSELEKLNPIAQQPVILKITLNGFVHLMLLEHRQFTRQFASEYYTLTGRSPSALLDYTAVRSFTQENERTSVQLVLAEMQRIDVEFALNWQLIDDLGWVIPNDGLSYSNLNAMQAIKQIVDSAGGMILSEPDTLSLTIKPLYRKTFWETIDHYDVIIPQHIVTSLSTDYEYLPNYNGITLTNDQTGLTAIIKRRDTAGDILLESINHRLFTAPSMASYAKSRLAKAGLVETHTLAMPAIHNIKPADILAFNGEWWGVVNRVQLNFDYAFINQTVEVERVNLES